MIKAPVLHAAVLTFVVALAAAIAPAAAQESSEAPAWREAVQAQMRGLRRITTPNGVEELAPVQIGGVRQWISVRGRDRSNPILLFIHGGPGFPEMPASWYYQAALEDHFTVVQWDQRGAGKSLLDENGEPLAQTITFERMMQDGEEMAAYLRQTYNRRRIFVVGHSWGTVIGLELARRHPDWLHAYVGVGQVINSQEGERAGFAFALEEARRRQNQEAIAQLEAIAPYPATDGSLSAEQVMVQRRWISEFGAMSYGRDGLAYEEGARMLSPEYTRADLGGSDGGQTFMRLLPALTHLDFSHVTRFDCPIVIFAGRHDYAVPSRVVERWFNDVRAPQKRFVWFEDTAHMVQMERPGLFAAHLINDVRPLISRHGDRPLDARPRQ